MPVVVHCNAGNGRTGHVRAAWLLRKHNWNAETAIAVMAETATLYNANRNPYEADDNVYALQKSCRK